MAEQVDDVRRREHVALHRAMAAFALELGHVRQRGEGAAAADHDLRPVMRLAEHRANAPVDLLLHFLPVLRLEWVGSDQPLGDPDRAQGQGIHVIDGGAGGENHLDAAAADVHYRGRAALEVEMAGGGVEGELGLLLARNHVDPDLVLAGDLADELATVGGLAHRAGGDRPDLPDFEAVGDRLHLAERRKGALDGLVGEPAGPVQLFSQPDHLPLFVQNAIGVVVLHFGDGQPDRVGANVDGGQAGRCGSVRGGHGLVCRFP